MKITVVYHSESGNTAKMAECIVKGIQSVEGMEAKAFHINDLDENYIRESQGVIFGTPTYMGTLSGTAKVWLESAGKYNLAGKLGGAFATANYVHGGADIAMQCVLLHLMMTGMMVYSGGGSKGNPVIHLGPVAIGGELEKYEELFEIYGKRFAEQTAAI